MGRLKPCIIMTGLLLGAVAQAQSTSRDFPMSVNTNTSGESVTSAPASGMVSRSGNSYVTIKINNTCFGTNLRGVGNPLAASSTVRADLVFNIDGKDYAIMAKYPALLVTKAGMTPSDAAQPMASSNYEISGGGEAALFGNSVLLKTGIPSAATVDGAGNITVKSVKSVYLKSYSFKQEIADCTPGKAIYGSYGYSSYTPTYACGDYMGKPGVVSASFGGISVSSDKSNIEVNVSFPGETSFCGSYWSPLMVFFNDERPKFNGRSDFPLNPMGQTMWPEAGAPGWFLALDRDGSGKIDQKIELFGDLEKNSNGFEVLKKLDSNKDGVIDRKDKEFKNLVLWNDKNGDGKSDKEEIMKLSKKVIKISLDYKKGILQPIGSYAEARERAKFWYKENGKIKTGEIIDIWLAPAETRLSQR